MLQFVHLKNPKQLNDVLKSYDPLKDTWLVSDLKSKQHVQDFAIKQHGYYTDDAILRISDFWKIWIRRLEPTLRIVSSDFIRILVQNFIDQFGEQLEVQDSESGILYRALQEFYSLHLHPESQEIIEEWLAQQKRETGFEPKWYKWFQISRVCLNYILTEHQAIDSKWSAAYLKNHHLQKISWDRKIFIDLGSEISSVELGHFHDFSQSFKNDIVVLVPTPDWGTKFENLLGVYKNYFGFGQIIDLSSEVKQTQSKLLETKSGRTEFFRFTTQLAEVKNAVGQIRKWLDEGADINKIAIIAADIEYFWPSLQIYLDVEGIPYQKEIVSRVNALGDVQTFLAQLKNFSTEVSWDSLERSQFSRSEGAQSSFEKFKSLFYQLYDEGDLAREQKIKDLYYKKIDLSKKMTRDEFLAFMSKIWIDLPESNFKSDLFEPIFKDFLQQSLNLSLGTSRWITFLKNRLRSKEIVLKRPNQMGIQVLSLMSAHSLEVNHRIYLGLNEEFFAKKNKTMLKLSEAAQIRSQFDLHIDCSEESYLDFNLRWQLTDSNVTNLLSSALTSFSSDPLNASLFFIENSPHGKTQVPLQTRADELQSQLRSSFKEDAGINFHFNSERLAWDKGGDLPALSADAFRQLSVGDIENFAKCGFRLLASRGFKLRDYAQVGIDLDNRDRGTLVHAIFEFVLKELQAGEVTEAKISNQLDQLRSDKNLYLGQDEFWKVQKTKFLRTALKFLEIEKQRVKFFRSETEKPLSVYFDFETGNFIRQKPQKGFEISLRIDRVDQSKAKGYYLIYDYKGSDRDLVKAEKWIEKKQFQMLIYLHALKLNFEENAVISGALYYFYRDFKYDQGIIARGPALEEIQISGKSKSLFDVEDMAKLLVNFTDEAKEIFNLIENGKFSTRPYDTKICEKCDWNKICRAPHLT